jgi:DNA-binding FadR family transcriptional regulator
VKADLAFHEAICELSGNETLLDLWRSLIGNITVMVLNVGPERMTALQDPAEHQRLFDAIASRDEGRIRRVFADVFEDGRREVAACGRRTRPRSCRHRLIGPSPPAWERAERIVDNQRLTD